MTDVFSFPLTFWILTIVTLAYYGAIFPFISLGQVFFIKKFGMDPKGANFITGMILNVDLSFPWVSECLNVSRSDILTLRTSITPTRTSN